MGRKKIIDEEAIVKINLRNSVVGIGDFGINTVGDPPGPGDLDPGCNRSVVETSGRTGACYIDFG